VIGNVVKVYHDEDVEVLERQRKPVACTIAVRAEIEHMSPYTPGESLQAFSQRTGMPVESIIKLNANESPYDPVPAALHALRYHDSYNQYPDASAAQLKDAISRYTSLDTDHIVLGHGSMEIINILWHLFLSPGDALICCSPTFALYETTTKLCGAQLRNVARTRHYEIDPDTLRDALTPETKMIVVCSPNNPTGNLVPEDVLMELLDLGRLVVVDEAYIEFSSRPRGYARLVADYDNLIVLRTFSKWAGLAGLRVGYALFPLWIVPYMQRAQQPFEVNVAGYLAAIETLQHLDEAQERVQRIIEEREHLFHLLTAQPYLHVLPSEGNFILARIANSEICLDQIRQVMEAEGILLRYFPQLEKGQDYLRVTVGLAEHTSRLAHALAQFSRLASMKLT
jgi:histidinol-phosphate aminotransferase